MKRLLATAIFAFLLINLMTGWTAQAVSLSGQSIETPPPTVPSVITLVGEDVKGRAVTPGLGFFVRENLIATDYRVIKDAVQIHAQLAEQGLKNLTLIGVDSQRLVALLMVSGVRAAPLRLACLPPTDTDAKGFIVDATRGAGNGLVPVSLMQAQAGKGRHTLKANAALTDLSNGGPVLNQNGEAMGIIASLHAGSNIHQVVSTRRLESLLFTQLPCESPEAEALEPEKDSGGGVVPGGIPKAAEPNAGNANSSPQIIRKTGGVLNGSKIRPAAPLYPPLAKMARISGAVVVEVTVGEDGDVISARAISGHPLLKEAAINAARGWKFTPVLLEGQPVKIIGTITFNFNL